MQVHYNNRRTTNPTFFTIMDYTSMICRNMAVMIDVSANDSGAEFKRRSYERVLNALRDCPTPIQSLADVLDVVQCGGSIRRKIAYIIDHDDDLPEVKAFFESSYDDGEDHDDDAETESEDTDLECESEEDDAETESEEDDAETESEEDDDADTESVGSNDEDAESESEMESELVVPSQLQALRAVNKIEYSMLAEEGALTVTEALAHLQTLRAYVMATIICADE
jgi:cobalamin biosynthesis protein CobT